MKIYREGREIYEIKDYKQVGKFMEVATIETTIKSTLPIDIKVGDYVIFDYNNLKYTLYDVYPAKKQARSSTYGEAYVYDLKFKADTEQLSICPFLDLVPNDNNLTYSSLPSFSTFENVYGIADRLQANLDYLYPNQWRFDVVETTDAELLETLSDAREFAISGESCLDGLRKIYDIWGVGFIHSVEDGVNIITIGKSAGKTSLFRYGKGRGLRTIKKNLQNSDQLCTRAYVFGSTRNIPARWYNNKGYIGEAQYAPNLMIPPSKWVDGIPQGAYIDAIFDGENRIEKYGLKIKTFSYDGSDSNKTEIYPSVEKMTAKTIRDAKAEIGENTYIPSPTLYPDNERMDMVLEGSNIVDDGTSSDHGYILFSDKQVKSVDEQSETIPIAEKTGDSKYTLIKNIQRSINICTFDIEKTSQYRFDEILRFVTLKKNDYESTVAAILYLQTPSGERIELRSMAMTDKLEDFLQLPGLEYDFKELGKYTLVLKLGVSWNQNWVIPQIGEDVYLTYTIPGAEVVLSRGKKILGDFFNIKIKQIGFNINDYTASSGAFKNIHFRSGMCSGMSFNIAKCSYIEEIDAWELKCRRVEDSSISQRFPNNIFNIAKDDRFVLLDINMPDLYIYTNMQRLYDTALEDLKHFSTPQYVIEPQIDNIQMARSPQVLKEGMYMAIDDLDISIFNEEALIDSVTITNRGTDLRSFEVTLRNDKVYNRYNKLADRIADLESAAQKTASNSTITPVQETSESKVEAPAVGFDENALADYLEENKYTTEGDVTNILSPVDKEVSTLRTDFDNLNTLLNGNVGGVIDTWNEVVAFLDGYSQSDDLAAILAGMNEDISNRVLTTDFEKANDSIKDLLSYFDANGNANNALKLGGHSAEYFATATAVNTLTTNLNSLALRVSTNEQGIATNKTNIATLVGQVKGLADDVEILKGYWYIDDNGNLHTTHNIVVEGGGAFGKGSTSGGDVPSASVSIKFEGSDVLYNPINGVITLPAYPSAGGGVADSVAWSNISGKPNFATVATSGKYSDLSGTPTIPTSLKSPYALTFGSKTYDGSSAKTILASDLGALTAHQDISHLLSKTEASNTYQTKITSTNKIPYSSISGTPTLASVATSGKYSDLSGTPSSLPASDVYAWAKKAILAVSDVPDLSGIYLPLSGGVLNSDSYSPLIIDTTNYQNRVQFKVGGVDKALVGWNPTYGAWLYNYPSGSYLHIKDDGTPCYNGNTLYHAGNFNPANYLPLSGGTVTGPLYIDSSSSSSQPLALRSNAADASGACRIQFIDANNAFQGYVMSGWGNLLLAHRSYNQIGVGDSGIWCSSDNGITKNALIHSGNIGSQSVDAATRLVRVGSITDANTITFTDYSLRWYSGIANTATNLPSFSGYQNGLLALPLHSSGTTAQIYMTAGNSLYFRGNTGADWKTIAFTDSNVASATKLQTARTIWGKSFDGTENVSGNISLFNDAISWLNDSSNYSIQIKDDGQAYYKAYYGHHFYTNGVERMHIVSGGHVLIGTAIDKAVGVLQVAGQVASYNSNADAGFRVIGSSYSLFFGIGSGNVNRGIYDDTNAKWWIYRGATTNTYIPDGNVLIGTTSDNGAKLQVEGSASFVGGRVAIPVNGDRILFNTSSGYTMGILAMNCGNTYIEAPLASNSSSAAQTPILIGWRNGVYPFYIAPSGNVLIGTTSDNGAKLNVSGYIFNNEGHYVYDSSNRANRLCVAWSGGIASVYAINSAGSAYNSLRIGVAGGNTNTGLFYNSSTGYWGINKDNPEYRLDVNGAGKFSGNLVVTGGGAFGSDIRYKDITSYRQLDLETIANAPLFTFKWNDREDKIEHLGTSAQYWLETQAKDAVNITNPKFFHLDYGALGVGIGISVAREVKVVKSEVEQLRDKVKDLETRLSKYEQVWQH